MRLLPHCARPAVWLLAGLLLRPPPAVAEADGGAMITIGPEWSVVREMREVDFSGGERDLLLDLPAQADLASLNISGTRSPVRLLSWTLAPAAPSRAPAGGPALRAGPEGYGWDAAAVAPPAEGLQQVRCRLASSPGRTREVEVFYRTRGMAWRCNYEITVRGDISNYLEPIALDIDGRITVSNGTGRAFPEARLELVGEDPAPAGPLDRARAAPGLLLLDDDSPLADLWRHQLAPDRVPYVYALPASVSLPARGSTSAHLVTARRKPAERLYAMNSDDFELGASGPWRALRRFLTFRNDASFGLGPPLPPGPALIYMGAVRGALYQRAWIGHTAAQGEIRIDLGPAPGVTGVRRSQGRTLSAAGFTEESVDLQLANALPSAVLVEIVERPPVPLAWDVTRSSRPYDMRARRLHYRVQLEARSETAISYTVRVTEPEL